MKLHPLLNRKSFAGLLLALGATAGLAAGLVFDQPRAVVAGGGGVSAAGPLALTATIGQPVAGVMTGGPFTLEGGFLAGEPAQPLRNAARSPWWRYGSE